MGLIAWGRRPSPVATAAQPRWVRLRGGRRLARVRRRGDVVRGVSVSIATAALASLVAWRTVVVIETVDLSAPLAQAAENLSSAGAAALMALLPVDVDGGAGLVAGTASAALPPLGDAATSKVESPSAQSVLAPEAREALAPSYPGTTTSAVEASTLTP